MDNNSILRDFVKWKMSQSCEKCGIHVSIEYYSIGKNTFVIDDVDDEYVSGYYCRDCIEHAKAEFIKRRFVELYNGMMIFRKNHLYYPSWGSACCFTSIHECREWIDSMSHISCNLGDALKHKTLNVLGGN